MAIFLEILSGPMSGNKYEIFEGLKIGRREGEVLLDNDPKVSGLHAKIEKNDKDQWVLVDLESANALVLNGRRVKKVTLIPGIAFRVGTTDFLVQEEADIRPSELVDLSTWQDKVERLILERRQAGLKKIKKIQTFTPALQLEFQLGVQADTVITCSYGPRIAGSDHLDIELLDPEAPEKCFQLIPGPGIAFLEDHSQGRLQINNSQVIQKRVQLYEGDLIQIGGTQICVRYL